MWKRRPVVARARSAEFRTRFGDGVDGLLSSTHPSDLEEFAGTLRRVLSDDALAQRLGEAGYRRVRDHYLSVSALEHWASLVRLQA